MESMITTSIGTCSPVHGHDLSAKRGSPTDHARLPRFFAASEKVGALPATVFFDDPVGNVTLVIDPAGVKTHYDYNGFSQVTTRIDFYQSTRVATTTYTYDAAGPS